MNHTIKLVLLFFLAGLCLALLATAANRQNNNNVVSSPYRRVRVVNQPFQNWTPARQLYRNQGNYIRPAGSAVNRWVPISHPRYHYLRPNRHPLSRGTLSYRNQGSDGLLASTTATVAPLNATSSNLTTITTLAPTTLGPKQLTSINSTLAAPVAGFYSPMVAMSLTPTDMVINPTENVTTVSLSSLQSATTVSLTSITAAPVANLDSTVATSTIQLPTSEVVLSNTWAETSVAPASSLEPVATASASTETTVLPLSSEVVAIAGER